MLKKKPKRQCKVRLQSIAWEPWLQRPGRLAIEIKSFVTPCKGYRLLMTET